MDGTYTMCSVWRQYWNTGKLEELFGKFPLKVIALDISLDTEVFEDVAQDFVSGDFAHPLARPATIVGRGGEDLKS